ncbi:HIRAN domain-containing protein [Sphingobium sp. B2]|uniref:HIRAN domain-containing protein n=1 Tax=Sphingobium sp. B2 TaxID=2583228 RepID=UPI0011A95DD0|nr:HIRAN domain-containing protein [Sphingobium sp. B2]
MSQLSLIIVGTDHPNKDRTNRRSEILWSHPGEEVHLVPEPRNPVDHQAVAVFSTRGVQIGYVRAEQCQLIRSYLTRGRITGAIFQDQHEKGAIIRIGMDGEAPNLPEVALKSASEDSVFYPDWMPPDE